MLKKKFCSCHNIRYLGIIFYDVSYTIYHRFHCIGTLWLAKHEVLVLERCRLLDDKWIDQNVRMSASYAIKLKDFAFPLISSIFAETKTNLNFCFSPIYRSMFSKPNVFIQCFQSVFSPMLLSHFIAR
jgi:hypothetical protein